MPTEYLQTAIVLLLVEMDRKSKEDALKKAKSDAEKKRNDTLHDQHLRTEEAIRKKTSDLEDLLGRIDDRLLIMEEQLLDLRRTQAKRRWLF